MAMAQNDKDCCDEC